MANPRQINWNQLLRQTKRGDQSAQNELCDKIRVRLWANLQYTVKRESSQVLEDLLHDCLEIFIEKLDRIDSNPQYYADRILRNKVGDLLRLRKGRRGIPLMADKGQDSSQQIGAATELDTADPESDFTRSLETDELMDQLLNAIKKMDPFCRAFFLARLENRDTEEIKNIVNKLDPELKRSAYYVRVLRCRRKLRKILKAYLEER